MSTTSNTSTHNGDWRITLFGDYIRLNPRRLTPTNKQEKQEEEPDTTTFKYKFSQGFTKFTNAIATAFKKAFTVTGHIKKSALNMNYCLLAQNSWFFS